ncbi:MAG: hypothetical protein IPH58_07950 [Sphingobacteriales bacterium]|nr:hypothetical protein [Sphingobacteriales bacterium]
MTDSEGLELWRIATMVLKNALRKSYFILTIVKEWRKKTDYLIKYLVR